MPSISPIIKWAGGKSGLLDQYAPYFPASYQRYFEPFVGSAAVFFHLQPQRAFLSDSNAELVALYQTVRDYPQELIAALHQHHNDKAYYYAVRAQRPADLTPVERAARFIFLNRTCFNGLYRVNRSGQFNVPFGNHKNPTICNEPRILAASAALQSTQIDVARFEEALGEARAGDLIYLDPPYAPLSVTSSFTSYTSEGFGADDQRRLAAIYHDLHERGCLLMLSNSSAPLIYELYEGHGYTLHPIAARRAINSNGGGRGVVTELLITNFDGKSPLS